MQQQAESITKKICIRIRWGPKLINGSLISMQKTSHNTIKTQSRGEYSTDEKDLHKTVFQEENKRDYSDFKIGHFLHKKTLKSNFETWYLISQLISLL